MLTLSKLFKKPQTGDKSSVWMPAIEDNFQQLNDHTHNGIDSEKIPGSSVYAVSQVINPASWSLVSPGKYSQIITMPGTMLYDQHALAFKETGGNRRPVILAVERNSSNTFTVFTNDNALAVTVYYV